MVEMHSANDLKGYEWAKDKTFLSLDLETTGIDTEHDLPVSFALVQYLGKELVFESHQLVDPGVPIPQEAAEVHGISDEIAGKFGIPLRSALRQLREAIVNASKQNWIIVGMNVSFDLTLIDRACMSVLGVSIANQVANTPTLDVLVIDREFSKFRRGKRRLVDLAEYYGVTPDSPLHNSLSDAKVTYDILIKQMESYPDLAESEPSLYNELMFDYNNRWLDGFNKWRMSKGESELPHRMWPVDVPK